MLQAEAWPPARFSAPLAAGHDSLWRRFAPVFRIAWRAAMGYDLDEWQEHLLHAATELLPTGRLRYRQVLISLGRQNGKTEIAAALGLLVMLWKSPALVIGIASSAEQARLVYDRTMQVIRRNPALAARFERLTDTRGIQAKDGSKYEIKAAKSAALQGLPIDLGLCDEVHLLRSSLWTDLLNGTGGRPDCFVVGITTAGDEDSELLKRLYDLARTGDGGQGFGHFIWEAPEARIPADDATLAEYLAAANPAIACGRVDVEVVIADVRTMPEPDAVRYRLNRFVAAKAAFISLDRWLTVGRPEGATFPEGVRPVFAIDQTPDQGFATIAAAVRVDDVTWTELVASIARPSLDRLVAACTALARHSPATFVMDGYSLRDLAKELKRRGLPVRIATQGDVVNASGLLYAKVARGTLRHGNDPLLSLQVPRTVRKNVGEAFRISRQDSSVEIDAVMATALAVHAAEVDMPAPLQLFVA